MEGRYEENECGNYGFDGRGDMKGLLVRWIAVLAVAGWAGTVQAASMNCTSATAYELGNASAAECFSGNDTNQIDASFEMFGMDGWVLSEKNDSASGDSTITFSTAPVNGSESGDWEIDSLAGKSNIVITLKAGNGFGAFLLDQTAAEPLVGAWSTGKDLSHASIYYNVNPVPLPAAAWLFGSALFGLVGIGRRKKA